MPSVTRPTDETPLVIALDVGTSSVRALLFDRQGSAIEGLEGRRPTVVRATPDGGSEIDAEELFQGAVQAIDDLLRRAGPLASQVKGIATCTLSPSLVGVGSDEAPLTPIYTWADTRGGSAELRARLDEKAVHGRTGCVFHPSYVPAKLLWLARRDPALFGKVARWVSIGEFLVLRLFGRARASLSSAAWSGLLDIHRRVWDKEVLGALPIREEQLSPLGDFGDAFRGLRDSFARRWPALKDVPWFLPISDAACNSVGSGCATSKRIAVMVGTSAAMRVVVRADEITFPWGLFCYRVDARRYVPGGALSDGGNLVAWLRSTLRIEENIESQIAALEPDAHGLTFLPFLAGERNPGWAADARAAISGLSLATRPVEILRAGMEAIAYRFALVHELLTAAVPEAKEVIASGGALLKSPAWTQILCDVLNRPVTASAEIEASGRGAALLALEALGTISSVEEVPASFGRTFQPDAARHARYREALQRHRRLYDLLIGGR